MTVAIRKGLQKNAKILTEDTSVLSKYLDEVVIEDGKITRKLSNLEKTKAVDELAGMAKDIPSVKFKNAEEFLESAKRLSKIKPSQALEYLDEALPHFNHYVKDGKVFQISDTNCVNVVENVEEFLRTGKITKVKHSRSQSIYGLATKYNDKFLSNTIPQIKKLMKEGERGIIYGVREAPKDGHVFNVLKINGELKLVDGQSGKAAEIRHKGYMSFKYLKTY